MIYGDASTPFYIETQQKTSDTSYVTSRKYYNGMGQLLQTQLVDATINGTEHQDVLADSFYDAAGQLKKQTVPYTVGAGSYYHTRSAGALYTETFYDSLGRAIAVYAPDGTSTAAAYSLGYQSGKPARITTSTDAKGEVTTSPPVRG